MKDGSSCNAEPVSTPWHLLAMHGWGSDQRAWHGFWRGCEQRGWPLERLERGYGRFNPATPDWPNKEQGRRALLINSLGLHLVPAATLAAADAVVLLASFGRFVPSGAPGRPLRQALKRMDQRLLNGELQALFADFRQRVAEPQDVALLPPGIEDGPISEASLERLRQDLALLASCDGLPATFPTTVPVLIVEAGADAIVHPLSRQALREALPQAEVLSLAGIGHGLMLPTLPGQVLQWIEDLT